MNRRIALTGISIGFLAAAFVLALSGPKITPSPFGPMISECDGRIRSVAIQYVRGATFVLSVYRQFFEAFPHDITIYAICPDQASFDELQAAVANTAPRLIPILTHHPMTAWARDRWISLSPQQDGSAGTIIAPQEEYAADSWPQRAGDAQIAGDLGTAIGRRWIRSGLYFDGGDLLADSGSVFVSPAAIIRNLQHTCTDVTELKSILEKQCGCVPILLPGAPDHHVGMYMMAAGENRVVVGDPHLAEPLFNPNDFAAQADFSDATQRRFDSVAKAAAAAGYRVFRISCVPSVAGKTYITFVNGIIDQRGQVRTIFMPSYKNQDRLNAAATQTWQSLGYKIVPIDVTSVYPFFGTLHCLVNVLDRN